MTSLTTTAPLIDREDVNNSDEVVFPPGDLFSDEPPMETDFHRRQMELLIRLLEWLWRDRSDFYVSGNSTIYYSPNQRKSEDFRGPDFYVILGCDRKDRKSWVVWQENGQYPNIIIEILSNKTASVDKGLKKQIYQDIFRTPNYFWFDPRSLELQGFHLLDGQYQPIIANEQGWLWSRQLDLYLGIYQDKLRFFTAEGNLVLLPEEEMSQQLEQERQKVEQERQRAEQAEQELARLKALIDSPQI